MSFGSIHLAVHVIAPKIVYYELFWILHLILSKYMRSKSENVIFDSRPMQEIDTEASCAC